MVLIIKCWWPNLPGTSQLITNSLCSQMYHFHSVKPSSIKSWLVNNLPQIFSNRYLVIRLLLYIERNNARVIVCINLSVMIMYWWRVWFWKGLDHWLVTRKVTLRKQYPSSLKLQLVLLEAAHQEGCVPSACLCGSDTKEMTWWVSSSLQGTATLWHT